jgi:hypothetical protein
VRRGRERESHVLGPSPEEGTEEVDDVKRVHELLQREDEGRGGGRSCGGLIAGERGERFPLSCQSLCKKLRRDRLSRGDQGGAGGGSHLGVELEAKLGAWRSTEDLPNFIDATIDTAASLALAVGNVLESRLDDGSALSRMTEVAREEAIQGLQERREGGAGRVSVPRPHGPPRSPESSPRLSFGKWH